MLNIYNDVYHPIYYRICHHIVQLLCPSCPFCPFCSRFQPSALLVRLTFFCLHDLCPAVPEPPPSALSHRLCQRSRPILDNLHQSHTFSSYPLTSSRSPVVSTMAPSTNTPQSSPNLVQTTLSNLGRVQAARVQKARVAPRPKPRVVGMRQQRLANLNGPTPALRDDGQEMVGSGVYSALCDVKVLSKHSSVFFDGPIKTVGKDAETADRHRLEATTFPILRKNTVVSRF